MSKYIVSVCGCGWLGKPLAKRLVGLGYAVKGTKRKKDEAAALAREGIEGFAIDIMSPQTWTSQSELFNADTLIINIAAGRKTGSFPEYVAAMSLFIQHAKASGIQHVLFVSSTSVYGNAKGLVTENLLPVPETDSGRAHVEIENVVREVFEGNGTILRLAGLIGGSRHPIKLLSGRTEISGGNEPVNLIHREDCIRAIENLLHYQVWGETLHLSSEHSPSREEYYQWSAKELGLAIPHFLPSDGGGKIVNSDVSRSKLSLALTYPSPYDMLPEMDK